jgi:hypothetical protein
MQREDSGFLQAVGLACRDGALVVHYQIALAEEYTAWVGSLLPLEGEGEDEGGSKATCAQKPASPLTSVLSPPVGERRILPKLNNEEASPN